MSNDTQDRQIMNWLANPEVARIDTIPQDNGAVKCHIFTTTGADQMELIGIGTVKADGDWELHSPSPAEWATIKPQPDEAS